MSTPILRRLKLAEHMSVGNHEADGGSPPSVIKADGKISHKLGGSLA
jgi:hypothetical protein